VSDFLHDFLLEEARGAPRAYLAAFGKHPGWNDHIDDLGIETESLVMAKRLVYLEGLSSQIDSGAWEKLTAVDRVEGFDHIMLWQRGTGTMLGTMISSRDGKGRTRYPMILCAQFIGVPVDRVLRQARPVVEAAMEACRATTSAEAVRTIVDQARQKLRGLFGDAPGGGNPVAWARPLPGEAELGPDDEGLRRILYHMRNHLGPWAPGQGMRTSENGARGAHLRMAQVFADADTAILSWGKFFDTQIDPRAPRLMLWPRQCAWIDVIVGEPVGPDFFGLRASTHSLPCVDDVPYEMDAEFRAEANSVIARLASPDARGCSIFAPGAGTTAAAGGPATVDGAPAAGRKRKVVLLLGGLIAMGFLIALIIQLLQQPPPPIRTGTPGSEASPTPAPGAPPIATSTGPIPSNGAHVPEELIRATPEAVDVGEAWKTLCRDYYEWFGALQAALKDQGTRARWSRDPHLAKGVLEPIAVARRELGDLDPRVIAGVQGQLQTLGSVPPTALADPAIAARILSAHSIVKSIAAALDSWPKIGGVIHDTKRLRALGWAGSLDDRPTPEPLPWTDRLVPTVEQAMKAPDSLRALVQQAETAMAGLDRLAASGDPALVGASASERARLTRIQKSATLERELPGLRERLGPVLQFLDGEWSSGAVARERFTAERSTAWAGDAHGADLAVRWLEAARAYLMVPEAELPLGTEQWEPRVAAVRALVGQLELLAPAPENQAYVRRLEKISSDRTALRAKPAVRRDMSALESDAAAISAALETLAGELAREVGRHADPVGWVRQVREIHFGESAAVEAEWIRRRDELLRGWDPKKAKGDIRAFVEFRGQMERTERFLRDLLSHPALSAARTDSAAELGEYTQELGALARDSREESMQRLLQLDRATRPASAESFEAVIQGAGARAIVEAHAAVLADLMALGTDLPALEKRLADGAPWQELPRERIGTWLASPRYAAGVRLGAQLARFATLENLASANDPARLIAAVRAPEWTSAITAWTRLCTLAEWPVDLAGLEVAVELARAVSGRLEREVADTQLRVRLQKQTTDSLKAAWSAAYARATTDDEMTRVLALVAACGLGEADLSGRQRLNAELMRLRAMPWLSLDDTRAREERDRAIRALKAVAGQDAGWVLSLIDAIMRVNFEKPAVNLALQGPGRMGWRLDSAVDPTRLAYLWDDSRVEFILLDGTPAPVYLAVTELPIRLFVEWVDKGDQWPQIIAAHKLLLEDFENGDPRRGPRSYTVVGKPGAGRRFARTDLHWLDPKLGRSAGISLPPSERAPLNYVSAAAAQVFSRSLNCRLPSEGEWRAALAMQGGDGAAAGKANMRDASWRRQLEFQKTQRDPCWPDSDIFVPSVLAGSIQQGASAGVVSEQDDQLLWFADVDSGTGRGFRHLLGNVAEFVAGPGDAVGVIGGSALSPPEYRPTDYLQVDAHDSTRGFSDVGLRLAFSVEQLSAAAEIQRVLISAGFVR